jgi:hypothetical protein
MKINIEKSDLKENLYSFLRKCGYAPFHDSYVKVLSASGYPRFHIYTSQTDSQHILNLHLGKIVEEEAERIEDLI